MYYEIYNALKGKITPIEGIEGVEWFRNQYETASAADGHVYIEGVSLTPSTESKQAQRTTLILRLHIVTVADGQPDTQLQTNDHLAACVLEAIEGIELPFGESLMRPLELAGWSCLPKVADYLVTVIELRARA